MLEFYAITILLYFTTRPEPSPFTFCNHTVTDTTHTFPKDIPTAFLRTHTWGSLKLMLCALSRNLETTVPFQDRSVCKGITKALPDTHTFNVFEPNQIICRGSD
jgi:hypothetical protein